jgi:hypothetical protein
MDRFLFFVFPQTATNYLTFALNRLKTAEFLRVRFPDWSSVHELYRRRQTFIRIYEFLNFAGKIRYLLYLPGSNPPPWSRTPATAMQESGVGIRGKGLIWSNLNLNASFCAHSQRQLHLCEKNKSPPLRLSSCI